MCSVSFCVSTSQVYIQFTFEVNCFLICPYMKFFYKLYSGHNMNTKLVSIGQRNNKAKKEPVKVLLGSIHW